MKQEQHAARIWLVLLSAALNKQTMSYKELGKRLGLPARGLGQALGYVMRFCDAERLPPLTVLVVKADAGKPSTGLETSKNFERDRQRVFGVKWFDIPAPRAAELRKYAPVARANA